MWRLARTGASVAANSETCFTLQCSRRNISKPLPSPSIHEFTSELADKQPIFPICPASVHILNQPSQFYTRLLDMINKAEHRIFISSLYIGSEETELLTALTRRLRERPNLQLKVVLDLNRSTRPGSNSTAKLLLPLLREFHSQVKISMFRSPYLRGLMARIVPPRFNEGWGTWHAKIYGSDDDVMISGANLNKSYFTNRQDRYVFFSGQRHLAQYCHDFMETVTPFSYQLLPKASTSSGNSSSYSYSSEDYTLKWPNPDIHPHYFHTVAEEAFSQFQMVHYERSKQQIDGTPPTSARMPLLVPLIQAGQFNIREEECIVHLLFRKLSKRSGNHRPLLDLTSGYFSLYTPYQDLILNNPDVNCRIVAASPKANGFYGSNGVSGRIPEGYTLYEKRFMTAVTKAGRLWNGPSPAEGQGVLLSEWEKPGWTYHAKGIWVSLTSSAPPVLTLFGSTNLNSRSAHIDTELSFLMILPSEPPVADSDPSSSSTSIDVPLQTLRGDLMSELARIRFNAHKWRGHERNVRWTTKLIVWLVKGML